MAAIEVAKKTLRAEIAEKIAKLTVEEKRKQSKVVYDKLINLPSFKASKRVSVFLSTSDEIDTEPIVRTIFAEEKKCYVPRYSKAGMQMVRLHSMDDWANLPLTKWNIKQPALKDRREDALEAGGLDFIVCPGVAFTATGNRLGHGGGYYDAYIKNLRDNQPTPPHVVAVAFNKQVVEDVPITDRDQSVDLVLYDE